MVEEIVQEVRKRLEEGKSEEELREMLQEAGYSEERTKEITNKAMEKKESEKDIEPDEEETLTEEKHSKRKIRERIKSKRKWKIFSIIASLGFALIAIYSFIYYTGEVMKTGLEEGIYGMFTPSFFLFWIALLVSFYYVYYTLKFKREEKELVESLDNS